MSGNEGSNGALIRLAEANPMGAFWLDLRSALRQLGKTPGSTAVAVLSLALGIAGTTVMFGVLNALLLTPPSGVRAPEDVARLYIVRDAGVVQTPEGGPGSYLDFLSLEEGTRGVEHVAAFLHTREYDHGLGADARRVRGQPVSGRFFRLLGVAPAHGRLFNLDDDRPPGSRKVVVLSHGFWQRQFGADPDVVGRSMLLNGEPFTVVGVASPEFRGIDADPVDLWTPLGTAATEQVHEAATAMFRYLTRIEPEADRRQVQISAETSLAASAENHPDLDPSPGVILGPLNAARGPHPSGAARLALLLWLGTAMLLLIACANVANLLLARATTRRREFAVRRALGAGEPQIVRQLLTESVLLALLGGVLGLGLAVVAGSLVQQFPELPPAWRIDLRLVGFALLASLVTALLFGLVPAIRTARTRPVVALNESQAGGQQVAGRLPTTLVAGQVALAVMLLVGGGIFIRSLQKVVAIDTGMELKRLVVPSLDLRSAGYEPSEAAAFYDLALERLQALPGVEAASMVMPLPLSGSGWGVGVYGGPGAENVPVSEGPYAYTVAEDFFRTAGIRILRGRPLTEEDRRGSEPTAVVSERLALALAADGDAVGMCVPVGWEQKERGGCTRIVGVAADVRHRVLQQDPVPYVYRPEAQVPFHEESFFREAFLVRTAADPGPHLGAIRSALHGLAPDLPYVSVERLETIAGESVVRPMRIAARLLTLFGALALMLAAVGLYGTLARLVTERARELGIRMALGATSAKVVRLVMWRATVPVAVGIAVGLAASAGGARLIAAQFHGLSARDPIALALVVVTLLTAASIATWLPARRAASVDPMVTLKGE